MTDTLRIVSYSYALQNSCSSIFLCLSSFTGWSGCQTIPNLFFQCYQIKIAGTPLNSFWCLILKFVFLNCLLCFPSWRVSESQAGDCALTWWHLDCPSGHYKESWSIFLKSFSIWERDKMFKGEWNIRLAFQKLCGQTMPFEFYTKRGQKNFFFNEN